MKNKIRTRGSVTIWLSLILGVLMPLLLAGMISVRSASVRVQILDGVQTGLYSLFGQYDRDCFQKYGILVLDTGCGSESPGLSSVLDIFRKYCDPVLAENGGRITVSGAGFTGYRTVAENNGAEFYAQAVRYMGKRQEAGKLPDVSADGDKQTDLEIRLAVEAGKAFEAEDHGGLSDQSGGSWEGSAEETVIRIMEGLNVSPETLREEGAALCGSLSPGPPVLDGVSSVSFGETSELFRLYLADKMGSYRRPSGGGLDYEMEYLAFGLPSDRENLESVIGEILLFREGKNRKELLADASRMEAITKTAEEYASRQSAQQEAGLLMYGLSDGISGNGSSGSGAVQSMEPAKDQEIIQNARKWLIFLEIRKKSAEETLALLNGNTVDAVTYEDIVRILACRNPNDILVPRTMKMEELNLQKTARKEFCFGNCITALEVYLDASADGREFHVSRSWCYE